MSPEPRLSPKPSSARPKRRDLIRLQRQANEQLVVAALRADEQVADAHAAQSKAEDEAGALRVREEALRLTVSFRERLLGIIGHDLRTPLNTMLVAAEMLVARGRLNDEDARLAKQLLKSGRRMARLLDQLVQFTRARLGGGFEMTMAPCDLGEICQEVANELGLLSSVPIRETRAGNLRGAWDADRLAEALSNIASNAVDHAKPGTAVAIAVHEEAGSVVAEITNEGTTIPADALPVIFEAFRQGEPSARPGKGHLGLGLYVAHQIVLAHGGALEVRSANGVTTFTIRLPGSTPR